MMTNAIPSITLPSAANDLATRSDSELCGVSATPQPAISSSARSSRPDCARRSGSFCR
jgi:hypothetical protein